MPDQSTRKRPARKAADRPNKPYPDFPLTPHASGTWQKKVRGRIHYFGRWGRVVNGTMTRLPGDGWEQALAEYKAVADDLHAGRTPRPDAATLTVADLCNHFLTAKKHRLDAGELTPVTFAEYRATTDRLVAVFGRGRRADDLAADDFARYRADLAGRYGPVRLGNEVQKARTVFRYGTENGLVEKAVRFGSEFTKPSRKTLRLHKARVGKRLFTAAEVRALAATAGVPLRAMTLLGVNCGFGNSDVGTLPLAALDLDGGWVTFPRPKTGIERRARLWPETAVALREALAERPAPKGAAVAGLVFVTKYGNAWAGKGTATAVSHEFGKLLGRVGIARRGVGFYSLRHTFRTAADAARDPNAVRTVMGHVDASIDAVYSHGVGDDRLAAVADLVRGWVFPPAGPTDPTPNGPNGTAEGGAA